MMKPAHILLFITVCCISIKTSVAEKLGVQELLSKYAESQEKLSSFIAETECSTSLKYATEDKPTYFRRITKVYAEGERYHTKKRSSELASKDASAPIEYTKIMHNLWDGNRHMMYRIGLRVDIDRNEVSAKSLFDVTILGIPFLIRTSARERLDITLRQAKAISVRNKLEQIGSENCYVIDAKTASGAYTVWIDPQHDYHVAQAEIRVGPGEKYRSWILDEGERCLFLIRNIRFEKIDGRWIPMEADTHTEKIRPDPDLCWTEDTTNKITQITLNPDHEALGSLVPDIENGTTVIDRDSGVRYTWREGMKFVVDEWDGRLRYVPEDWSILVVVGKPLPEFEETGLDVTSEDIRDKAILLCFFNMNQRPSRNCLLQLNKRAKELTAKNVVVVAVQASKVDEDKLNDWVKKNNISFPVGMIQGDEEKIRFTWGVRSLPWLILTDKEHTVTAEGFSVVGLDEKLNIDSH